MDWKQNPFTIGASIQDIQANMKPDLARIESLASQINSDEDAERLARQMDRELGARYRALSDELSIIRWKRANARNDLIRAARRAMMAREAAAAQRATSVALAVAAAREAVLRESRANKVVSKVDPTTVAGQSAIAWSVLAQSGLIAKEVADRAIVEGWPVSEVARYVKR